MENTIFVSIKNPLFYSVLSLFFVEQTENKTKNFFTTGGTTFPRLDDTKMGKRMILGNSIILEFNRMGIIV